MDTAASLNLKPEIKKNEQMNTQGETMGTIAQNSPSPLFSTSSETAGTVASNTSSASGGSINYNA